MITNGSIDSMEKSAYSSSVEDNQSYDVYEAHNPNPTSFPYHPTIEYHKSPARFENQYAKPTNFDLAYKNEGFRDNSTFATNSRADSIHDSSGDETPIMQSENGVSYSPSEYYNDDTLPLNSGKSDSTLDLKRAIRETNKNYDRPNDNFLQELKGRLPQTEKPPTPPRKHSPTYSEQLDDLHYTPDYNTVGLAHPIGDRPRSADILETDFDEVAPPKPKARAKSEVLLETNFDYTPPEGSPQLNHPISDASRSKSQPLETAM